MVEVANQPGRDAEAARHKSALGATMLLTAPGVPMLLHDQEWGEATPKLTGHNPLHWDLLEQDAGLRLKPHYQNVISMRRAHPALRGWNLAVIIVPKNIRRWSFTTGTTAATRK